MWLKCLILFALTSASLTALANDLVLTIEPLTNAIHAGDYPRFVATVSNHGSNSVTLVELGDGSLDKWRTPFVGWPALSADVKKRPHPKAPVPQGRACGNINPIKLSEIFLLKPGEQKRFNAWIDCQMPGTPGRYRLVFYYENIPDLEILGIPLGSHENGALYEIRKSTQCRLVSYEIVIDVLPKTQ
jgi:hypothetical protein